MADATRQNWTAEQYFADPRLSRSKLEVFRESAGLYHGIHVTRELPQPEPSASMRLGSALHYAALEPAEFTRLVVDKPKFAGEGARKRQAEFDASLPRGALVLSGKERATVEGMVHSLERGSSPAAKSARALLWGNGNSEVSITWRDDDAEMPAPLELKARLDRLLVRRGSLVVDLKSTDDPSPDGFSRSIHNYGYHRQAAFYCNAAQALLGSLPRFAFVVVRNEPPHEVAVYELEPEAIAIGQHEIRESLRALGRAMATGDWSAPWEGPAWEKTATGLQPPKINLPIWARKQGERALAVKESA